MTHEIETLKRENEKLRAHLAQIEKFAKSWAGQISQKYGIRMNRQVVIENVGIVEAMSGAALAPPREQVASVQVGGEVYTGTVIGGWPIKNPHDLVEIEITDPDPNAAPTSIAGPLACDI